MTWHEDAIKHVCCQSWKKQLPVKWREATTTRTTSVLVVARQIHPASEKQHKAEDVSRGKQLLFAATPTLSHLHVSTSEDAGPSYPEAEAKAVVVTLHPGEGSAKQSASLRGGGATSFRRKLNSDSCSHHSTSGAHYKFLGVEVDTFGLNAGRGTLTPFGRDQQW